MPHVPDWNHLWNYSRDRCNADVRIQSRKHSSKKELGISLPILDIRPEHATKGSDSPLIIIIWFNFLGKERVFPLLSQIMQTSVMLFKQKLINQQRVRFLFISGRNVDYRSSMLFKCFYDKCFIFTLCTPPTCDSVNRVSMSARFYKPISVEHFWKQVYCTEIQLYTFIQWSKRKNNKVTSNLASFCIQIKIFCILFFHSSAIKKAFSLANVQYLLRRGKENNELSNIGENPWK